MVSAGVCKVAVAAGSEILAVTDTAGGGLGRAVHQGPIVPVKEGRGGQGALTNVVVSVAVPFKNTRAPPVPSTNSKLVNHDMPVEVATSLLLSRRIGVQKERGITVEQKAGNA